MAIAGVWLGMGTGGSASLGGERILWLIPTLVIAHWLFFRVDVMEQMERRAPRSVFWFASGAAIVLALVMVSLRYRPFIYFQF